MGRFLLSENRREEIVDNISDICGYYDDDDILDEYDED